MPSALVILSEDVRINLPELGPALAAELGMVAYDVIAAFNRSRVLPFENIPDEKAETAAAFLSGRGVPAAAVSCELLPPDAKIFTVHNADALEAGLDVQTDLAGKMRTIPWERVTVLSAARMTSTRTVSTGPRPNRNLGAGGGMRGGLRFPRIKMPRKKTRSETCEVLALLPAGTAVELRFQSNAFNFDYLGDRLAGSTRENVRTFGRDLVERSSGARVSPGLRALVEDGRPPPEMASDGFRQYNRWLRLLAEAGLEPADPAAGSA
jgi:hypothetical protein